MTRARSGHRWRKLRETWQRTIDRLGGWTCRRCGGRIPPYQPRTWHLGHPEDGTPGGPDPNELGGIEPECVACNLSAGGRAGAAIKAGIKPNPSRDWLPGGVAR